MPVRCQSSYVYKQFVFAYSDCSSTRQRWQFLQCLFRLSVAKLTILSRKGPPTIRNYLHGFVYHSNLSVFYLRLPLWFICQRHARPDSDIDIVLFLPELNWGQLRAIGGVHMDLEASLCKKIDLSVCLTTSWRRLIRRPGCRLILAFELER
jgi:hypothetical protein